MTGEDEVTALVQSVRTYLAAFRPLIGTEEGSAGRTLEGTVTLVEDGDQRFLITARHAVKASTPYYIGAENAEEIRWPREKMTLLSPVAENLPEADVAVVHTATPPTDGALSGGIPAALAISAIEDNPNATYIAVGFPASKGKVREALRTINAKSMHALVEFVPVSSAGLPHLDARVHMCFRYSQSGRTDLGGQSVTGAHPRGMSGGGVFIIGRPRAADSSVMYVPFLVAILTEFHADRGLLVATRVRRIWEALGRQPLETESLYRAAGV
jgi:hypothetical protein